MSELLVGLDPSEWPELATMIDRAYEVCARMKLRSLARRRKLDGRRRVRNSRWSEIISRLVELPLPGSASLDLTSADGKSLCSAVRMDPTTSGFGWSVKSTSATSVLVEKFEKFSRQGRQTQAPKLEDIKLQPVAIKEVPAATPRTSQPRPLGVLQIPPHPSEAEFAELALKFYSDDTDEAAWKRINDQELPKLAAQIKVHKRVKVRLEAMLVPVLSPSDPSSQVALELVYRSVLVEEFAHLAKVEELETKIRELRARLAGKEPANANNLASAAG